MLQGVVFQQIVPGFGEHLDVGVGKASLPLLEKVSVTVSEPIRVSLVIDKDEVQIIARNNPYTFECINCGKKASEICTDCSGDTLPFLCSECATTHECGEDMLLPIVNSPRFGVCGYTG